MRSRAVSLPLACCAAMRFSPPPRRAAGALLVELPDDVMHGRSPFVGCRAACAAAAVGVSVPRGRPAFEHVGQRVAHARGCAAEALAQAGVDQVHIQPAPAAGAWPRARRSPPARRGSARPRARTRRCPRRCSALTPSTGGFQRADGGRSSVSALAICAIAQLARRGIEVGLVVDDDVGELDDAALDRLQLVAGVGQRAARTVDHAGDRDLALADADRLDDHDVEARRPRRPASPRASCAATPPSVPPDGRRPDERLRVARRAAPCASCRRGSSRRETRLDGSTASTATRWPAPTRCRPERLDERALARRPARR